MNFRKFISGLILLAVVCSSVSALAQDTKYGVIEVKNGTAAERGDELVSVSFKSILDKLPSSKLIDFKLIDNTTKEEVPYQLEMLGAESPQNLLVKVGKVRPKSTLSISIVAGKPAPVKARTFARYVPERYEDFAWENDKVAFRMYGNALASRKDNALGFDVWSKRTEELVIDKWYESEDYHKDHGEGMDYYSVGNTLGAGDLGVYLGDSIVFTNNYNKWKVLDNGPLRSTFEVVYEGRKAGDLPFRLVKRISIDAGSQLYKVAATFEYDGKNKLPVVVGLVMRKDGDSSLIDKSNKIIGYWEPEFPNSGITGVGAVFISPVNELQVEKGHVLGFGSVVPKEAFSYYTGAAWNRAGVIMSGDAWFDYLRRFSIRLKSPLVVGLK